MSARTAMKQDSTSVANAKELELLVGTYSVTLTENAVTVMELMQNGKEKLARAVKELEALLSCLRMQEVYLPAELLYRLGQNVLQEKSANESFLAPIRDISSHLKEQLKFDV